MPRVEELYKVTGQLKALKRRGWILRNCLKTESDADHSWGVAFLAMLYAPDELDKLKCIELALVHDLAEIEAGDFTPADDITEQEKHENELNAIKSIATKINKNRLVSLFEEFEAGVSPEACFVKELDKLDLIMQLRYFIEAGELSAHVWDEFKSNADRHIKTPSVRYMFEKVCEGYLKGK